MLDFDPLLEVEGLSVSFRRSVEDRFLALHDVCFSLRAGESKSLVGESGSGKSLLARSLMGILPEQAEFSCRKMDWRGRNLCDFSSEELRAWRRDELAVIWQNPQSSLVPVYRVGRQMHWLLQLLGLRGRKEREHRMLELFTRVGLRDPERVALALPGDLSGGECQRVMVAMALARRPRLLIADEPTSNLDVKLQAEIVELLEELAAEFEISVLFITHDLALASKVTDQTVVLHQGIVVEEGRSEEVLKHPNHPYTQSLVAASLMKSVAPLA